MRFEAGKTRAGRWALWYNGCYDLMPKNQAIKRAAALNKLGEAKK
jgi:hypothetical protein